MVIKVVNDLKSASRLKIFFSETVSPKDKVYYTHIRLPL